MKDAKALLVVSFGTSYPETCERTIAAIEADLAAAFPDRQLYRAWTSRIIRRKVKEKTGVSIDSVAEAMEMTERYSDPDDKAFVNGILGTILREHEAAQ